MIVLHGTRLGTILIPPGPPEDAHIASYAYEGAPWRIKWSNSVSSRYSSRNSLQRSESAVFGGSYFIASVTRAGLTMLHAPKVPQVYMKLCEQAQGVRVKS